MSKIIECNLCGKKYKRPGSLKRHLNVCEIISNSKKTNELDREETYNTPSIHEIYIIVQKLVEENEKQKKHQTLKGDKEELVGEILNYLINKEAVL